MKAGVLLTVLLVVLVFQPGCRRKDEPGPPSAVSPETPTPTPTPLRDPEGLFQIVLPEGMVQNPDLNEEAALAAEDPVGEVYLVVLTDPRDGLPPDWDLAVYSEKTRELLAEKARKLASAGPRELALGGLPALQYEIRASAEGEEVVYLHTAVEGPEHFFQVVVSTLASRYEENRERMEALLAAWSPVVAEEPAPAPDRPEGSL